MEKSLLHRDEYKEEYKKLLNARYYNYISKDKIRELLKSKDVELTGVISYRELEELLGE